MRKTLIYFLVFFLIAPLFPVIEASAASEPVMRVKLRNYLGNQKQITVVANGEFKTSDGAITLRSGEEHKIAVNGSSLNLYKGTTLIKQFNTSFSIVPVSGGDILNINNF